LIKFSKMNGNGNNFLILENLTSEYSDERLSQLAIEACNTKFSIGADGILVIERSDRADFKMRLFNSNGFEGEMCGNGARCITKYAYIKKLAGREVEFETLAGIIKGSVLDEEVRIFVSEIDVDSVILNLHAKVGECELCYSSLTVGVPHSVIFLNEYNRLDIDEIRSIGRSLDSDKKRFTNGVNTNFVKILDGSTLQVVTYERGVEDITESCGTGSCASAIVATILYGMKAPVLVKNLGGDNKVFLEACRHGKALRVFLQGRVEYCAEINMYEKQDIKEEKR